MAGLPYSSGVSHLKAPNSEVDGSSSMSSRPIVRVLHVLGSLDRGGTESRLLEELRGFRDVCPVEVHFLLLSGYEGELAEEAKALGALLHPVRVSLALPIRYWALMGRIQPTVVHAYVQYSSGGFMALAWLRRVPKRVVHFRSTTDIRPGQSQGRRRRLKRQLSRLMIRRFATDIIAVSTAVLNARWPPGSPGPAARVVFNGIPPILRSILTSAETAGTVVQVGRIDDLKNQAQTIAIFAEVHSRLPTARLLLVGRESPGSYAAQVRLQVRSLGLADAIEFCGVRSDVRESILARAAVMLHPTKVEGLPGVLIEAASVGTPVVASDIGPNREVADLVGGIELVPLDADASIWADAVEPLLRQPVTQAARLEAAARFEVSPFCIP